MSLANLIVQGDRAHLITDSGYFRRNGTIAALGPKTMIIPGLPVAIAMVGSFNLALLAAQIPEQPFRDVRDFIDQLPTLLASAYENWGKDPDRDWSRLLVAFYSARHGRAFGGTMFTTSAAGPPGCEPWRVHPTAKAILPQVSEEDTFGRRINLLNSNMFDPSRDALPLVQAQRDCEGDWGGVVGGCYVAGDIDMITVSSAGAVAITLASYPDVVGRKAKH